MHKQRWIVLVLSIVAALTACLDWVTLALTNQGINFQVSMRGLWTSGSLVELVRTFVPSNEIHYFLGRGFHVFGWTAFLLFLLLGVFVLVGKRDQVLTTKERVLSTVLVVLAVGIEFLTASQTVSLFNLIGVGVNQMAGGNVQFQVGLGLGIYVAVLLGVALVLLIWILQDRPQYVRPYAPSSIYKQPQSPLARPSVMAPESAPQQKEAPYENTTNL